MASGSTKGKGTPREETAEDVSQVALLGWRGDAPWLLLIWVLASLFFWDVLFAQQSLYFRDGYKIYYPQARMTVEAILNGELPLWEPKIGTGYPFQADPHSMIFYPMVLLLLLLPWPRAYNLFVVGHVPLGGTFLYLLMRRWGLSRPASAFGGIVLMFCGYTVSTTCLTTLLRGTIWAPLALLAFDGFLRHGSRVSLLLAVLVVAISGSGTDPHYVLFTLSLMAAMPWICPAPGRHRPLAALAGTVLAGAGAGALLAYQYLPLGQMILWSDRTAGVGSAQLGRFDVDPWNLYNLVLPLSFPEPASAYYRASFHGGTVPFYPDIYWGVPVLAVCLAALGWLVKGPAQGETERNLPRAAAAAAGLSGIALMGLLVSLGHATPAFSALMTLVPPLQLFRYPAKYLLLSGISMSILAAMGLEAIRRDRQASWRILLGVLGIAVLAGLIAFASIATSGKSMAANFLTGQLVPTGDTSGLFDTVRTTWLAGVGLVTTLSVFLLGLVALALSGRMTRSKVVAVLAIAASIDLVVATRPGVPSAADTLMTSSPPVVELLPSHQPGQPHPRFLSYLPGQIRMDDQFTHLDSVILRAALLSHMSGALFGLNSLASVMSVRLGVEKRLQRIGTGLDRPSTDRLAASLGTGHTLGLTSEEPAGALGTLVGEAGPVRVRALPAVSPRVFIARSARRVRDASEVESVAAVMALPDVALFEGGPSSLALPDVLEPLEVKSCRIERYDRGRIQISFDLRGQGLLVVLDAYYPNWKALVDGQERVIVPVAGLVRGVPVKEGERSLIMTYEPWPFRVGAGISLVALLLILGAITRLSLQRPGKGSERGKTDQT